MRIAFLLPGRSAKPAGGFKVVYEYANRLARHGHEVSVVHPWDCHRPRTPRERVDARLWVLKMRLRRGTIAPWFKLDRAVRLPVVVYPTADALPAVDALVATAWHTAPWVDAAVPARGAGFYLIQGYETWDGAVEPVRETWRLPLHKIVISHWLEQIASELGEAERTTLVPIGMDLDRLGIDVDPAERGPRIGALFSGGKEKGAEDIVATLVASKRERPQLSAVLYGTAPRPAQLPAWIEYEMLPSPEGLRRLYNSCSIFLQASRSEGWGLPASEAMLCGCALVTVDNGGSREYAVEGETALVVAPEQRERLAERIAELLDDEDLRLRLARAGAERLRAFTWERSVAELEAALAGEARQSEVAA